ncbi:MAG: DUF6569 family protein [bacterium]
MKRITKLAVRVVAGGARATMAAVVAAAVGALLLGAAVSDQANALTGREVPQFIEMLEVGEPTSYENLTVVPVYRKDTCHIFNLGVLDEALKYKWLKITEVEGGRVPQVEVTNLSDNYVYMMGGEILTGCRQDRLVGRDVLLAPRSKKVIVPVYCVEQGRWTYESDEFSSRQNLGTPMLRAEAQKAGDQAQSKIWNEVGEIHIRGGRAGETRYQTVFETETVKSAIDVIEGKMVQVSERYPDAIGVVVGVGDQIVSVDVFATSQVFKALWPKILRSAALATVGRDKRGSISAEDAARALRRFHDARYEERPAVDEGTELVSTDKDLNANVLINWNSVFHLAAFPEGGLGSDDRDPERRIPVWRRQ